MKTIALDTWPRADLYRFYSALDYPHFNVCADVDITHVHQQCRKTGVSRYSAVLYGASLAANNIEEFRLRIRGDQVVLHEKVHPSYTVLQDDNTFCFCETSYTEDINMFFRRTKEAIQKVKENPNLKDEPGRDDYLFISSLPWVRFTSVSHPIHMNPVDCIPRITWGKFSEDQQRIVMPLSVQVHHGLADGFHVARFFELFQGWADRVKLLPS